jgi:hypothetical protein
MGYLGGREHLYVSAYLATVALLSRSGELRYVYVGQVRLAQWPPQLHRAVA